MKKPTWEVEADSDEEALEILRKLASSEERFKASIEEGRRDWKLLVYFSWLLLFLLLGYLAVPELRPLILRLLNLQ